VADGGTNELTNLITACQSCNLGKRDVPLAENAAVNKARAQMEELQERREQLELIMQWREGLCDLGDETVERPAEFSQKLAPGWSVSEHGKRNFKKWLQQFSVTQLTVGMDIAATAYLKFNNDQTVTQESWETAFGKIIGICRVNRASESNQDIKQLYYIRGILRKRIPGYFDEAKALRYLKNARTLNVPMEELSEIALSVKNLEWLQNYNCRGCPVPQRGS
jgi:hypothetical protein